MFSAIPFLRTQADTYGLAKDRIATWGASAGENLAAMAATRGIAEDGTQIQAAVNWFGPIVFDQMNGQFEILGLEPVLEQPARRDLLSRTTSASRSAHQRLQAS